MNIETLNMLLSEQQMTAPYQINAYEPGILVINNETYTTSVLVSHTSIAPWSATAVEKLTLADFENLAEQGYEILLIGTGETQIFHHPKLLAELPIGYEVMTTLAACRTFNLLANEGRAVVAGLLV